MSLLIISSCGDDNPGKLPDAPPDGTSSDATLTIDRTTHAFGSITLGQSSPASTFQIRNAGQVATGSVTASITGADASSFALSMNGCSAPLVPGTSCDVTVTFTPASSGAKHASLEVTASPGGTVSASLDGEGIAIGALTVSTSTNALGSVVVGGTGTIISTFTVTNTGAGATGALSVQAAGADPVDFLKGNDTCANQILDPTETCTFTVRLRPLSAGAKSALFTISAGPGGSVSGSVSGIGLAPASLVVIPQHRNFGSVVTGATSSPMSLLVVNMGGVETGPLGTTITNTAEFTATGASTCNGVNLGAGSNCTIVLTFTPTATGTRTGQIDITGAPGGTVGATLAGIGIAPGGLTVNPTAHAFANTNVGGTAASIQLLVTNTGATATGPLVTSLAGTHASQFRVIAGTDLCNGQSLAPAATCTISVTFAPTAGGSAQATFIVASATQSVTTGLSGIGVSTATLSIAPPSRAFGSVATGAQSAPLAFTVTNTGGQASGIPTVALTGAGAGQYMIAGNGCTLALGPAASCTIQVRFAPTATGDATAALTVMATPGGSLTAPLTGTGVAPGGLTIVPSAFAFPPTAIGDTSASQTLTVINNAATASGAFSITPTGDFALVGTDCASLAPGASCTVTLSFTPTAVGPRTGALTLTSGATTIVTALSGTGRPRIEIVALNLGPVVDPFDFGTVIINTTTPQDLRITVRNNTATSKTLALTETFGGQYTVVSNTCGVTNTIDADGTCVVNVRFRPTSTGVKLGSLAFSIGAGATNSVTQNLTGTGTDSLTIIALSGTAFGSIPINTTSSTQSFRVVNPAGSVTTGALSTTFTASPGFAIVSDDCDGEILTAGDSCLIDINFAPGTTVGPATATLTVTATPGGMPSLMLTAAGVAPTGAAPTDLTLTPSMISEDAPSGSTVGTLTTTDADVGDTFIYTLVGGAGSADNVAFTLTGALLQTNGPLDFETKSSYSIRVRVTDSGGNLFEEALTISVVNVDEAPVAIDDTLTVLEDAAATAVDVLANDTDIDAGPKVVMSITQPANGSVVITGGGAGLTYQPNANYFGTDTFSYTLNGGSIASVNVTVTAVDDAPVAVADARTIVEDAPATAIDVLANDTDIDGGPMEVIGVTQPVDGTVTFTATGVTFTPASNFTGVATFTYTLNGGSIAMVTITVTAADDPPEAIDDAATMFEDAPATAVNVLANDLDVDGGPIMIVSVTQPLAGAVVITGGGTGLTYKPVMDYFNNQPGDDPDTFTYTLNGGSTATVSITVLGEDDNPVAVADTATVAEDAAATAIPVLANDTDIDSGTKVIQSVTQPANGTVVPTGGAPFAYTGLTYQPNANYCNTQTGGTPDTFMYTVNGGSSTTVSVTVTCVNDAPTDMTLSGTTVAENSPAVTTVGTLAAVDVDAGDTHTFALSTLGCAGTDNGSFTIMGNTLRTSASFDFETKSSYVICIRATDSGSPAATYDEAFTITVTNVNEAPTLISLTPSTVAENSPVNTVVGALSATNPEPSDTHTFTLSSACGTNDNASFNISGSNLRTSAMFDFETKTSYQVCVRATENAPGTLFRDQYLTVTVTDVAEAPVFTSAATTTFRVGVMGNFQLTASGSPPLTFTNTGAALPGGITLTSAGVLSGIPNAGTGGSYTLQFTVSNGTPPNGTQTFVLIIEQAPQFTSANAATFTVGALGPAFQLAASGFPTMMTFSHTMGSLPSGLMLSSAGVLTGTPAAGTGGTYTVQFTASNGVTPNATQSFTITVNAPPVFTSPNNTSFTVGMMGSFQFMATGTPNTIAYSTASSLPSGVTLSSGGLLSGTPAAGTGGNYSLSIVASNGVNPNTTQAFTLSVNEAPTAVADPSGGIPSNSTPGSTPYHIVINGAIVAATSPNLMTNDTRGLPLANVSSFGPSTGLETTVASMGNGTTANGGTVRVFADGSFNYSPASSTFTGLDSFRYTITNAGGSSTATVSLAVGTRPDAIDDNYATNVGPILGNVAIDTSGAPAFSATLNDTGDQRTASLVLATNGTATVNANGTFTFNPNAGYRGAASITYRITNGFGTDDATIVLNVAGMIWFVDANAGTNGDGRLATPFNTLGSFASSVLDQAGDSIFLYSSATSYTGALTLLNTQRIIGQGSTASLAMAAGVTPSIHGAALPTTPGTRPTMTGSITTGSGNTLRGFNLGTAAAQASGGITGTSYGTLTISELSINSTSQALNLDSGTLTASLTSLSSSGGTNNVRLQGTNGTSTFGTGTLTGANEFGIRIDGGAGVFTYNGNISRVVPDASGGGGPVYVTSGHTGSLTLATGTITGTGGTVGNGGGLYFDNADGTYSFSGPTTITNAGFALAITNGSSGSFTFSSNTSISGANGYAIGVIGTPSESLTATVTYNGNVTHTDARYPIVLVRNHQTGTVTFNTGTLTSNDSTANGSANGGIQFNNADGTYNFNGTTTMTGDGAHVLVANGTAGAITFGTGAMITAGTQASVFRFDGSVTPVTGNFTYSGSASSAGRPLVDVNAHTTGTLTFQTGTLSATGGTGLQFTNADGTYNFTGTTTLNGGDAGIDILSGADGAFSFGSGTSITNPSGIAFNASTGGGNITYNGTIAKSNDGLAIVINSRTGGTTTFGGTVSSTSASDGIALTSNTSTTINFTAALTLDTSSSNTNAFTATGGGTISATGTGSTINSGAGIALRVENTTIGAGNVTFRSVSSNGASNGILLNNTGTTGGLKVVGNSSGLCGGSVTASSGTTPGTATATTLSDCTGGSILSSTAAGISLTSTSNVELTRMRINGNLGDGISGSSVTNFTLTASAVTNNGDDIDESGIDFDNLFGTSAIVNSAVTGSRESNLFVENTSGTLTSLAISGSQFRDTTAAPPGADGIRIVPSGTANVTVSITSSYFSNNRDDQLQFAPFGTATSKLTVTTSTFVDTTSTTLGGGITVNPAGSTNTIAVITNNDMSGSVLSAINFNLNTDSTAGSVLHATATGNFIGNTGATGSGSEQGDGIQVTGNGLGTINARISNNDIRRYTNPYGIHVFSRDGDGTINATIQGNTLTEFEALVLDGIRVEVGSVTGDGGTVCADIGGAGGFANTVTTAGNEAMGFHDIRLRARIDGTIRLPGYGGVAGDASAIQTYLSGRNTLTSVLVTSASTVTTPSGGAACTVPST